MQTVFADSWYWIALVDDRDDWHDLAVIASADVGPIVTTQEVLCEFLAHASARPYLRGKAVNTVDAIMDQPDVEVISQSAQSFADGLELYRRRPDKEYSLVDCISFATMEKRSIWEALTGDPHFQQHGFTIRFPECSSD